jgi:hypothetical protein
MLKIPHSFEKGDSALLITAQNEIRIGVKLPIIGPGTKRVYLISEKSQ